MWGRFVPRKLLSGGLLGVAFGLVAPAVAVAAPLPLKLTRVSFVGAEVQPVVGMVRTASGTLHLVYPTAAQTSGVDGIAARSISSSGIVGAQVQALSGWRPSLPGLVELPNGMLEAMFGAIAPALPNASTILGNHLE